MHSHPHTTHHQPKKHLEKNCDALVISCIDFRFQEMINKWIKETNHFKYDRVALAGGVYDLYSILKQIEISAKLHQIKKVILINHEDCGAYGETGTPEKHEEDLRDAKSKIKNLYPNMEVDAYYLHLDGTFEEV